MKRNKKYIALIFLCTAIPIYFFLLIMIFSVMISLCFYIIKGNFVFYTENIYTASKLAFFLGIPAGIVFWIGECRRLGIKIFGK
ncbi:hypothetical protein DKK70_09570 [Gilliamella apicola]|uniref:Uncharacterized protein n=1 Tax=Gilliamella apicola TaxID=1196095 RepID=A0A2V4E4Y4_9GAMM|nr:hypothetical protein [Gilliamella apicola]PXZ06899.1 hypothetical protein DKK70_09570 [Gilliamella apicola]